MNRITLPVHNLVMLIEDKANLFIKDKLNFSAYDVTLALRGDNPTVEISHQGEGAIIRDVIHNKMIGGAYGGHPSPHRIDYREDHRATEDGRPYVMYVYDPNWEAELAMVQAEAERVAIELSDRDSFTLQEALDLAQDAPVSRLDNLKTAITRQAGYQGFEFDEDTQTFTQTGEDLDNDDEDLDEDDADTESETKKISDLFGSLFNQFFDKKN